MKILVTGCVGFIGSHLCEKLLNDGNVVVGIDTINNYYSQEQKIDNLNYIKNNKNYHNFTFLNENLINTNIISDHAKDDDGFDAVINLGAMAGVRYSLENPKIYIDTNILGQVHLLEECKKNNIKLFLYASSSSVYGLNEKIPFSENDEINNQNSVYAVTKKCGEDFAKLYHNLYGLNVCGLRFFTVYGPRGRPDMFPYKLLYAIANNEQFDKYGDGTSYRDYTYIDDIIDGIVGSLLFGISLNKPTCSVYNLGNNVPISLNEFISACEEITGKKAIFNQKLVQLGDVPYTCADIRNAQKDFGYFPKVSIKNGIKKMYEWMNKI